MNAKTFEAIIRLIRDEDTDDNVKSQSERKEPLLFHTNPSAYIEKIKKHRELLEQQTKFEVGNIVVWKDGLRNRKYPDVNQPCIVLKLHENAVSDGEPDTGDAYDIQVGFSIIDEDDGEDIFLTFNVNSNRFRLYQMEAVS